MDLYNAPKFHFHLLEYPSVTGIWEVTGILYITDAGFRITNRSIYRPAQSDALYLDLHLIKPFTIKVINLGLI